MKTKAAAALFLAALFTLGLWWFIARPAFGPDPNPVMIRIEKGTPISQIVRTLKEKEVIRSPLYFILFSKATGRLRSFKYGTYLFEKNRYWQIIRKLHAGDTYRTKVTVPEGWTSYQIAERLVQDGIVADVDGFVLEVSTRNLAGKLFPETYYLEPMSPPETVIEIMAAQFRRNYTPELAARAKEIGLTDLQALTLASIIEREAQAESERALISSVYHNRLKKKMPLAADPTVQYALSGGKSWKERLIYKDLKIDSPYNTYKRTGLPPGPICNPGLKSLQAALYPEESPYLFFVADGEGSGKHNFFTTYRQHLEFQLQNRRRKRQKAAAAKLH